MREILFRGKRIDSGEWVSSGNIIHFNPENDEALVFIPARNEHCCSVHDENDNIIAFEKGTFYKVDHNTVGQYTGKRDSKNDRIFEGDILRIKWRGINLVENAVVRYDDRSCAYILQMRGAAWNYMYDLDAAYMQIESFEVIGNVWDDPELMEGM